MARGWAASALSRSARANRISNPCQYTKAQSDIPSLQAITDPCFPNFQLSIPDQYRVDQWLPVFEQQEQSGRMPNLSFMWLMTDHTTGSRTSRTRSPRSPTTTWPSAA